MRRGESGWDQDKRLARAILHNRAARRRMLGWILVAALALLAGGLWVVDDWLARNPWMFLLWWGGCALVTLVMMLFALYDALSVIREVRDQ